MDYVNTDAFLASLEICLLCVGSGLITGFILKFVVFGLSEIWALFRHISSGERGVKLMGETVTTALTTAFTQIKTDVLGGVATALPYALAIGGCIIAIRICWGFFKSAAR